MAESTQEKSLLKCFYRESTHAYKKSMLFVLQGVGILILAGVIIGLLACIWYFGGSSIIGVSTAFVTLVSGIFEAILSIFWAIAGFFAGVSWKIYTVLLVVLSPAIYAALKCLIKNYPRQVNEILLLGFWIGCFMSVLGIFVGAILYGVDWPFVLGTAMVVTSAFIRWMFDKDLPKREHHHPYGGHHPYSGDDS